MPDKTSNTPGRAAVGRVIESAVEFDDEDSARGVVRGESLDALAKSQHAHSLMPSIKFRQSGATSLLDASPDEVAALGGGLSIAQNEALLATVPDGVRPSDYAEMAKWAAMESDDEQGHGADAPEVEDALTGEAKSVAALATAPVPLPPGVDLTPEQLARVEAAVRREERLTALLPEGFASWSEVVAARGGLKRPGKARKAAAAVKQAVLDARIKPASSAAPQKPSQRFQAFGYAGAGQVAEQHHAHALQGGAAGQAFSWGRQIMAPHRDLQGDTSRGGKPLSRRQRRVAAAVSTHLSSLLASREVCSKWPALAPGGMPLEVSRVHVTADLGTAYVHWSMRASLPSTAAAADVASPRRGSGSTSATGSAFMARQLASAPSVRRHAPRARSKAARTRHRRELEDSLDGLSPEAARQVADAGDALRQVALLLGHRLQQMLHMKRAISLRFFREVDTARVPIAEPQPAHSATTWGRGAPREPAPAEAVWSAPPPPQTAPTAPHAFAKQHSKRASLDAELNELLRAQQ